jgi:hypothetical protein
LLEPSLPQNWQTFPWEQLSLHGKPISGQALVVRQASWDSQPILRPRVALFLDLFPQNEFSFLAEFQPLIHSGRLRTCRNDSKLCERLKTATDLFIMAHGNAQGLLDAKGEAFVLPATHPMPDSIWLLACNTDGAAHNLSQQLLESGCKTVVTATGDISAPEMANLVQTCFTQELDEYDPGRLLAFANSQRLVQGNHTCLTISGAVELDRSACAPWNRITWENERGNRQFVPLDDETNKQEFTEAYRHAISPDAWKLTRTWMMPPLLWLAEKIDHSLMRAISLEVGALENTPEAIRGLAAAARRVGNYVQVAKSLSLGLALADLSEKERANHLGAVVNLLIDLNLPKSAEIIIAIHEDIDLDDINEHSRAEFKRLDWKARTQARQGRLHVALDLMTAKRKFATADDGRELAWQLYLASWGVVSDQVSLETASAFANEAQIILNSSSPDDLGFGNETIAYLLRALSAYSWVTKDLVARDILIAWKSHALTRLSDDDPGPWAYLLAFLHLSHTCPEQHFERAVAALERTRYFLEASAFCAFASCSEKSQALLTRFQNRRNEIVSALKLPNIIPLTFLESECSQRSVVETTDTGNPAKVTMSGILPM